MIPDYVKEKLDQLATAASVSDSELNVAILEATNNDTKADAFILCVTLENTEGGMNFYPIAEMFAADSATKRFTPKTETKLKVVKGGKPDETVS